VTEPNKSSSRRDLPFWQRGALTPEKAPKLQNHVGGKLLNLVFLVKRFFLRWFFVLSGLSIQQRDLNCCFSIDVRILLVLKLVWKSPKFLVNPGRQLFRPVGDSTSNFPSFSPPPHVCSPRFFLPPVLCLKLTHLTNNSPSFPPTLHPAGEHPPSCVLVVRSSGS